MPQTQEYFEMSDGFDIFCRSWKPSSKTGRAIVFMHGIESHSGAFSYFGERLAADGLDCYAFDRRGFGNSVEKDFPKGDAKNFKRHLNDVNEIVQQVRKDHSKVFTLGHSIGTAYVLWQCANFPSSLNGLILMAPPVKPGIKLPRGDLLKLPFQYLFQPRRMFNFVDKWPLEFRNGPEYKALAGDPLCTMKFGIGWLINVQRKLANKMIDNASRTKESTLTIQGNKDIIALPAGATRLNDSLMADDKTLKFEPEANHWFYQALIPNKKDGEDARREEVFRTISTWLDAH